MAVAVCTTFSIQIHGFPDLLPCEANTFRTTLESSNEDVDTVTYAVTAAIQATGGPIDLFWPLIFRSEVTEAVAVTEDGWLCLLHEVRSDSLSSNAISGGEGYRRYVQIDDGLRSDGSFDLAKLGLSEGGGNKIECAEDESDAHRLVRRWQQVVVEVDGCHRAMM